MTHLAKEFALSDVALHKICKKHDIPNPPLGWWAKKAAGKAVKQASLPNAKAGTSDRITIATGQLGPEPKVIATARANGHLLASSIDAEAVLPANPIIDRTIAQLRKAKPSLINGLVTVEGLNVVKVSVAPASIDRPKVALGCIPAAAEAQGTISSQSVAPRYRSYHQRSAAVGLPRDALRADAPAVPPPPKSRRPA